MYTLFLISSFIFGTIIGSFLNVVILRYNTGMSINGRSGCFSCGKKLEWYELVPVVSFIMLLGKCSACKSRISWQYPLVELATGSLFLALFVKYFSIDFSTTHVIGFIVSAIVWSILVVITVYDIRHKIIPDGLVFAFAGLALISFFLTHPFAGIFHYPQILDLLAGPILFTPFWLLWLVSKGTWMGFGDAKLAIGMGWFVGLSQGISAVILGFWIGAVVSLLWMGYCALAHKNRPSMKTEIPFAPYLILGLLVVFFFHIDVLGLSLLLGV